DPVAQQAPVGSRRVAAAGHAAGHADDGDGVGAQHVLALGADLLGHEGQLDRREIAELAQAGPRARRPARRASAASSSLSPAIWLRSGVAGSGAAGAAAGAGAPAARWSTSAETVG